MELMQKKKRMPWLNDDDEDACTSFTAQNKPVSVRDSSMELVDVDPSTSSNVASTSSIPKTSIPPREINNSTMAEHEVCNLNL